MKFWENDEDKEHTSLGRRMTKFPKAMTKPHSSSERAIAAAASSVLDRSRHKQRNSDWEISPRGIALSRDFTASISAALSNFLTSAAAIHRVSIAAAFISGGTRSFRNRLALRPRIILISSSPTGSEGRSVDGLLGRGIDRHWANWRSSAGAVKEQRVWEAK